MLDKINSKKNFQFSILNFLVVFIWLLVIGLLVYSRFVNLDWGLPYPMHPDERNMANAIQQLDCKFPIRQLADCLNPHFFAYGQFPLYLGYLFVFFLKLFNGTRGQPISFEDATLSLRIISALASIVNVFVLLKIIKIFYRPKANILTFGLVFCALILIFSPFAVQFSHFGTTESLLILFYDLIVYLSLGSLERLTTGKVFSLALISGLAIATKVSSAIFLTVPVYVFMLNIKSQISNANLKFKTLIFILGFAFCTLIFSLVFSPHNFINFSDFFGSVNYESDVALGRMSVFYTRQFANTIPVLFQLIKVFPYALGWPVFIIGLIGFFGANWKDKKINLLRFAFLAYFIPSAIIYAKWNRFMAPILPLMLIFALLFLFKLQKIFINNDWVNSKIKTQKSNPSSKTIVLRFTLIFALCVLIFTMIIPGLAYLSIYTNPDVRLQASDWIYKNIPDGNYILSETANVVDIPLIDKKKLNVISFNFYDLDENPELQSELKVHLAKADYIFVPSRRIFANHTCYINNKLQITDDKSITNNKCLILKQEYPLLNKYYETLFSGQLGFREVAEFNSFPRICLPFTDKCLTFEDEQAEETWTVFDHPVIRIYKNIKS